MASTIIPFTDQNTPGFYDDIVKDGYHIFSIENAKIPDFYPNEFPDYPGVKLNELTVGECITVRVFFRMGEGEPVRVDGGYIDLEIVQIDSDHVFGVILTLLPDEFPLSRGDSLEIFKDEILYKVKTTDH